MNARSRLARLERAANVSAALTAKASAVLDFFRSGDESKIPEVVGRGDVVAAVTAARRFVSEHNAELPGLKALGAALGVEHSGDLIGAVADQHRETLIYETIRSDAGDRLLARLGLLDIVQTRTELVEEDDHQLV